MAFILGYDVGSSSIKATLMEAETGKVLASATSPERELEIELEVAYRKKRKKPDRYFIDLWEAYLHLKYHGRDQEKWQDI